MCSDPQCQKNIAQLRVCCFFRCFYRASLLLLLLSFCPSSSSFVLTSKISQIFGRAVLGNFILHRVHRHWSDKNNPIDRCIFLHTSNCLPYCFCFYCAQSVIFEPMIMAVNCSYRSCCCCNLLKLRKKPISTLNLTRIQTSIE